METLESLFITTKVFDPTLEGQAVAVSGSVLNGNYIVKQVTNFKITLIGKTSIELSIMDFERGAAKMVLLQPPKMPEIVLDGCHVKTKFTRNVESRQNRTEKQIKKENAEIERILQEHIEPMKLENILQRMRQFGYLNWNNNNASGFVKHAIKCGMNIKKIKTGVYSYDWEGQQ